MDVIANNLRKVFLCHIYLLIPEISGDTCKYTTNESQIFTLLDSMMVLKTPLASNVYESKFIERTIVLVHNQSTALNTIYFFLDLCTLTSRIFYDRSCPILPEVTEFRSS